jgi:glycosyltransferase involved in cell wall biosynthesis
MDRGEARRQVGWDDTERVVLFAATKPYEPRKRLDLAQAAVKHAEEYVGPIRLAIAENLPLESIPMMMNAADCLLLTSMAEGGPLVVKEAVLCALPVVATDVGDVRKVLAGISPSAVCKHDAQELGTALADVLKANRRSDGRDQRATLDQSTTIKQLLDLYQDLGVTVSR